MFVTNLWKMQKFPSLFGILTIMLFYHTTCHFFFTEFLFNYIWKFKKIFKSEIYIRIAYISLIQKCTKSDIVIFSLWKKGDYVLSEDWNVGWYLVETVWRCCHYMSVRLLWFYGVSAIYCSLFILCKSVTSISWWCKVWNAKRVNRALILFCQPIFASALFQLNHINHTTIYLKQCKCFKTIKNDTFKEKFLLRR